MAPKRKPARAAASQKKPSGPAASPENLNPYEFAQRQFDRAADHLGLDAGMRAVLRAPKRQLTVSIPVKMDNKTIKVFTGYRVQHTLTITKPQLAETVQELKKVLTTDGH
jgi:hypothetical protein